MYFTHMKKKMIGSLLTGMIIIPGSVIDASAEEHKEQQSFVQVTGIESALDRCYETEVKDNLDLYLVPTEEGEYWNMAFSDTADSVYVRSAPDENSTWVGILYEDSAARVLEYLDGWTKIRSGDVEGYVPSESLLTGEDAASAAPEYEKTMVTVEAGVLNVRTGAGTENPVITQIYYGECYEAAGEPSEGWYPVSVSGYEGWVSGSYVTAETSYSYGETREQEESRTAEETAERIRAEETSAAAGSVDSTAESVCAQGTVSGQQVIDYACQFIGNPYVWGGTSLTEGADCSGFVQSVYGHFGISLPRTTYDMVYSGYEVPYSEAQPGDLILYDGHVGLYMGDGTIVNAMNEADGIGICSATYTNIIAVRRVL